jgi:outer membrane protein assembly factor BamA
MLIRDDFRFDSGYDERLFGDGGKIQPPAASQPADTLVAPSLAEGGYLEDLQAEDVSFYPRELFDLDEDFGQGVIQQHDSLGLKGFTSMVNRRTPMFRANSGVAEHLWNYNRVEGLVLGLSWTAKGRGSGEGPKLRLEGAYATGSEEFRHYSEITLPWEKERWLTALRLSYSDRVVPYGSTRPVLNPVRVLFGGTDQQDYLRRESLRSALLLEHNEGASLEMGFEINTDHSIGGTTHFSFFGELHEHNESITDGIEHAATGGIYWKPERKRQLNASLEGRIAGGALGGDLDYARTDATVSWRRYWLGRHELLAEARYAFTAGSTPVQWAADIGGLTTVRGFSRRSLVGESALALRAEYLFPYDLLGELSIPYVNSLGIQLVPWFDAGRVWDGNSNKWIHSAGFGLQSLLGAFGRASYLRLDFSFPTADGAADDFRIDLRFAPGNL